MRKVKRVLSLATVFFLILSTFHLTASAQEEAITVKMMNYNVSGLPKFNGTDGADNHREIAGYIVENDFDIVAVQEDFAYHKSLVSNLWGFDFFTNHSGSIPGGDGLNIFTDGMRVYNEERVQWKAAYGDIAEGDVLTPKGILYTVVEISDGVYIDFYNIHADAFDSLGSRAARESNYKQIADMIEANYIKNNRPVVLTGDFNQHLHADPTVNSNMYAIFHERCGLKDAWVEIHNGGDYHDFSAWLQTGQSPWGTWDSVEKFMYKDGGGITVSAKNFTYTWVKNDAGEELSDHAAAECVFEFTITEDFLENTQKLEVVKPIPLKTFFNSIKWFFKDLAYILTHVEELIAFLS